MHVVLRDFAEVRLLSFEEFVSPATVEGKVLPLEGLVEGLREVHHAGSSFGPVGVLDLRRGRCEHDRVRVELPFRPHLDRGFPLCRTPASDA